MKDHTGCKRQFIRLSQEWYGSANLTQGDIVYEVIIGLYHPEGGTTGEFSISWEMLGRKITPKLTAYNDSWNALYQFSDMLGKMADIDGEEVPPDVFCNMLVELGIEDATP